eukprot:jgi/Mesen1/7842/ME000419S07157
MAFMAMSKSLAVLQRAIVQGHDRLLSICGDLFTRSRVRYVPREAARTACTDACLGLFVALRDHEKKRQLKRNLAAEVRGRHFTAAHPQPLFPPASPLPPVAMRQAEVAALLDTLEASRQALREGAARLQQRARHAARIQRAAYSAASPSCGALFGAPPAAASRAALQDAAAAARSVASAVASAVAAPLTPPSRKRAPEEIRKPPYGVRDSSLPCVTFPPARPLPPVPKYSWRLPCAPRPQPEKKPAAGGRTAGGCRPAGV